MQDLTNANQQHYDQNRQNEIDLARGISESIDQGNLESNNKKQLEKAISESIIEEEEQKTLDRIIYLSLNFEENQIKQRRKYINDTIEIAKQSKSNNKYINTVLSEPSIRGLNRCLNRSVFHFHIDKINQIMKKENAVNPNDVYYNNGGCNSFNMISSVSKDQYNSCGANALCVFIKMFYNNKELIEVLEKIWLFRIRNEKDNGMLAPSDIVQFFSYVKYPHINVFMADALFPNAYIALTECNPHQETYIIYRRKNHYVIHSDIKGPYRQ